MIFTNLYVYIIETRYHCPYKRCHGRFYYAPSDIRSHLESRHRVVIQSDGDYSKLVFKTSNGQLIRLEDERTGNLFEDHVEIFVSVDTQPNKTSMCIVVSCSKKKQRKGLWCID